MTDYTEVARVDATSFPFRARCLAADCHLARAPMCGPTRAYCDGVALAHLQGRDHGDHTVVIEEKA